MPAPARSVELLSPARDMECGIEAINHGADAVYTGAPRFSARAAANNSLEDIRTLCDYAHRFDARVYVALNTILKEDELEEAEQMIRQLYRCGADALIVQDMGMMRMNLPPIPLHASTQMDNRTPGKVKFLQDVGFRRVVLARELSLPEIRKIAEETTVPLEVFIHGSLCVSYSGQCYLSAALSGRSANRGECAQVCRLPYTLEDADGRVIIRNKHLLSLKDLNRSNDLEALLDAGVSSFKIEGRLKDAAYVKNLTAWYRRKLDAILVRRPEYSRSSTGVSACTFEPDPEKSFNRGFTSYFLQGRTPGITSFDTPKWVGEPVGTVKEVKGNSFTVAGIKPLRNGDGLTFFNSRGELEGFRVNRAEDNRVYPAEMPSILPKTPLYRNFDQAFDKLLSKPSAERKIAVRIAFLDHAFGFTLCMEDETGARVMIVRPFAGEAAKQEQTENIRTQLSKLGNTPFRATEITIALSGNRFVPSSLLAEIRRAGTEKLLSCRRMRYRREWICPAEDRIEKKPFYPAGKLTYLGNVSNSKAASFYADHGVAHTDEAFELNPLPDVPLMFTKHCLRYSLGWCLVHHKRPAPYREPYCLVHKDTRLRLEFDCKQCRMRVIRI